MVDGLPVNNSNMKIWKTINKIKYNTLEELINSLKNKNIKMSPWIEDIFLKKKNFLLSDLVLPINLTRVKLNELGFDGPTSLKEVYSLANKHKLNLVEPEIALLSRELYFEQNTGEWLRFATPLDSMIDTDLVPHLPKLGKALGFYFIETYWSYPDAVFHPHNEFVFKL